MRSAISILVGGVFLATAISLPAAAEPQVFHWWVQVGGGGSYVNNGSFAPFAETNGTAVGDVRVGFGGKHLQVDLGYSGGANGATNFTLYDVSMQLTSLQLGLRYIEPLGEHFAIYGRAAALLNIDGLQLTTSDSSATLGQTVVTGGLLLNGGAEWYIYTWPKVRLGLLAECGYGFVSGANFNKIQREGPPPSPAPIATSPVNLGSLNASGIQWRIAGAIHF